MQCTHIDNFQAPKLNPPASRPNKQLQPKPALRLHACSICCFGRGPTLHKHPAYLTS
jgi:hypothetical protein